MPFFPKASVPVRRRAARPVAVEMKKPERALSEREKQQVKRLIGENIELKFVNSFLTSAASTSTPIITGCTDIAQGDTDSNRNGDRVKLAGTLELRASMQVDVATGDVTQTLPFIRFILFQWHPTSESGGATEPTAANVLLNGPTGAPDVWAFYNHDQRQNYSIIYDEVHRLNGIAIGGAGGLSGNSAMSQYISRKVPLTRAVRLQMQYQAASTVNATNHIYMMTMSNLAADAQNPTIVWNVKIFFRDA